MSIKLSKKQAEVLKILRDYPDAVIMDNGWLTGGHGVKFNISTVSSLKNLGLIDKFGGRRNRISELGKTCEFNIK